MARSNLDLRGADNPRKVFGRWADYDYSAFISYAKADIKHAADIERRLNRFLAQPNLEGKWTPFGPVPRRLRSAFRDRSVQQAHHDIDAALKEKLDQSASLIVICSPDAVASTFVDEEIKHFVRQHGRERVFTYIVGGESGSDEQECFPEILRFELDFSTDPEGVVLNGEDDRDEVPITPPLGGDIRPSPDGDGPEMAFDKLLAGLLGVDLADVSRSLRRQETQQTTIRWLQRLAVVSLLSVWVVSILLWQQLMTNQRDSSHFMADKAYELLEKDQLDAALLVALEAAGTQDGAIVERDSQWARMVANAAFSENRLLASLQGHKGSVRSAQFSPQGDRIVTASDDGTARVWQQSPTSDGTGGAWTSHPLEGHKRTVWTAQFSPQGDRIVTASGDGTARVWQQSPTSDGTGGAWTSHPLEGHYSAVLSAQFSPQGDRIVTASDDGTARVWDVETGRSIRLLGHTDKLTFAEFSPDDNGRSVVTASRDGTARVWNVDSTDTFVRETICNILPFGRKKLTDSERAEIFQAPAEEGPCDRPGLLSQQYWTDLWADLIGGNNVPVDDE